MKYGIPGSPNRSRCPKCMRFMAAATDDGCRPGNCEKVGKYVREEDECRHGNHFEHCDDCDAARGERDDARALAGDGPLSIREAYERAHDEKRRLG